MTTVKKGKSTLALPKRARELVVSVGEYFTGEKAIVTGIIDQMLTAAIQGKTPEGDGPIPFSPELFENLSEYLVSNTTDIIKKVEAVSGIDKTSIIQIVAKKRKNNAATADVATKIPKISEDNDSIYDKHLEITVKIENINDVDDFDAGN